MDIHATTYLFLQRDEKANTYPNMLKKPEKETVLRPTQTKETKEKHMLYLGKCSARTIHFPASFV